MTYCTFEDVALMVGAAPTDFEYLGDPMNITEYQDMIEGFIKFAEDEVHRYCNVSTFTEHEVSDELHSVGTLDGRSTLSGYSSPLVYGITDIVDDYNDRSRMVLPREYPVKSINSVHVSYSGVNQPKTWIQLNEVSDTHAGQYEVVKRFNSSHVVLSYSMPRFGINNVKIAYTAGYPDGHPVYSQLKMAVVMIVKNMMNYKKANQEAYTIRGSGVSDYSQMFGGYDSGGFFLSTDVRIILDRWRRPYNTPDAYV